MIRGLCLFLLRQSLFTHQSNASSVLKMVVVANSKLILISKGSLPKAT